MRTSAILLLSLAAVGCATPTEPRQPAEPAPIVVEVVGRSVRPGFIQIDWKVSRGVGMEFAVLRRHAEQPWKIAASVRADANGRISFADDTVVQGERYEFGVWVPGAAYQIQGIVPLDVQQGG